MLHCGIEIQAFSLCVKKYYYIVVLWSYARYLDAANHISYCYHSVRYRLSIKYHFVVFLAYVQNYLRS
jgi:hypothetical protein